MGWTYIWRYGRNPNNGILGKRHPWADVSVYPPECSRDQALYRAIAVYGDLAQYDDIEAKRGENRPCLADDYF